MTTERIRANVPLAGLMHEGAEVEVEVTPEIQRLINDGRVSVVPRDGRGAGESAAAEGSQTGPEADLPIAAAAGRPMTDAEIVAAGGTLEVDDPVQNRPGM